MPNPFSRIFNVGYEAVLALLLSAVVPVFEVPSCDENRRRLVRGSVSLVPGLACSVSGFVNRVSGFVSCSTGFVCWASGIA